MCKNLNLNKNCDNSSQSFFHFGGYIVGFTIKLTFYDFPENLSAKLMIYLQNEKFE